MKRGNDLYVYMNGVTVGNLKAETQGRYVFSYDPTWLENENSRAISLSMPLTEQPYRGDVVYNFFDNLLPDSEDIRRRIQARFHTPSTRCFDLLSEIGRDCVGALQILPGPLDENIKKVDAVAKDKKSIARWLSNYQDSPLGMDQERDFRISLAGVQEKAALLWYKNKWHEPVGATPTSHIIKLPIGYLKHQRIDLTDSVENEWLCLKLLSLYGLSVCEAEVVNFEDVKTLVVKRFDRKWSDDKKWLMRLPQEDMCQVLGVPSGLKYESDGGPGIAEIMDVLRGSFAANEDRFRFMKTVFLFWVMGAIDGHSKNFSLFIRTGSRFELTPIYDVISCYPVVFKRQLAPEKVKMAMGLRSKNRHYGWRTIQLRHWFEMADRCHFPKVMMQQIIEEVFDRLESVIDKVKVLLPADFPQDIVSAVESGMQQVKSRKK